VPHQQKSNTYNLSKLLIIFILLLETAFRENGRANFDDLHVNQRAFMQGGAF
jgi:hypothetical protein